MLLYNNVKFPQDVAKKILCIGTIHHEINISVNDIKHYTSMYEQNVFIYNIILQYKGTCFYTIFFFVHFIKHNKIKKVSIILCLITFLIIIKKKI